MAALTSRARGFPRLEAKYEYIYFETGLLQEPMRFIHLISCTLLRQLLKKVFDGNRKFRGCIFF